MPDVRPPSASNSPDFLICNYCVFDSLWLTCLGSRRNFLVLQQGICQLYGSATHLVCHKHPPFNVRWNYNATQRVSSLIEWLCKADTFRGGYAKWFFHLSGFTGDEWRSASFRLLTN
jgi:hypothetical protein